MSTAKRQYTSELREQAAEQTRRRVLDSAKKLFVRLGIDRVTIAQIAAKAEVSTATVYALFKSKEGILRALMRASLFGARFQTARARLLSVTDPVRLVALTADVAREIYESESSELGLMRGVAAFSPTLRKIELEFEKIRFEMQEERIALLYAQRKARKGLAQNEARRLMWMYTSRDVFRMLVHEGGWTPDQYQQWLSDTLVNTLVNPDDKEG